MTAATIPAIVDAFGKPVTITEKIGRGGEGEVFVLRQHPQRVAKLYHVPPNEERSDKLRAMAAQQDQNVLRCAAWPLELLYDATNPEQIIGFVMPRVRDSKPLHILYGPKTRKEQFPKVNFSFLLHTSANVARLFAAVHAAGHVIGDVNHANLLVSPQGTVWAIDCDSFQVKREDQTYHCDVGVLTHQPPELQQLTTFRGVLRTANHDRFGLAVLVFQLLMMGRHPFAGKTASAKEWTLEQSIQHHRYVYAADAAGRGMTRPPGSLSVDWLPISIQRLFDRAFSVNGTTSSGRPTAEEWIQALEGARRSIRTCNENGLHQSFAHNKSCIWCDWANEKQVEFFPTQSSIEERQDTESNLQPETGFIAASSTTTASPPATPQRPTRTDEHRLWFAIQSIPAPKETWPLPRLSQCRSIPTERPSMWRKHQRISGGLGLVVGSTLVYGMSIITGIAMSNLLLLGYVFAGGVLASSLCWGIVSWRTKRMVRGSRIQAQAEWKHIRREAKQQANYHKRSYDQVLESFAEIRTAIVELPSYRMKRMQEWMEQLPERQYKYFLQQFRLEDAKIPGIGDGRKMVLQSFGIETAADLNDEQLKHVPGIGDSIRESLYQWRDEAGRTFLPNPRAGLTRQDQMMLDREVAVRRDGLIRKLEGGIKQISELRDLQDQLQQRYLDEIREYGMELAIWLADENDMYPKQKR